MKNLFYAVEQLGGTANAIQWANLGSAPLNTPQVVQVTPNENDDPHLAVGINTSSGATALYLAVEAPAEDDPAEFGIQKYLTTSTNVNADLGTLETLIESLAATYLALGGMAVINQAAADLTMCQFTASVAGLAVTFKDLSGAGPGAGPITAWSWDFGDKTGTSTAQNPSYTYAAAGTYAVKLTITDTLGQQAMAWLGVTVS